MPEIRTEFGFERTVCECSECASYCTYMPGALIPTDLNAIADHLGYDNVTNFAIENLVASGGATAMVNGGIIQIPTLAPKRTPEGACKFLQNGRCSIHTVAPYSCSFFDHSQSQLESENRSKHGLSAIYEEWLKGGLYAQLWWLLQMMGLIAPSAKDTRERMRREMRSKE